MISSSTLDPKSHESILKNIMDYDNHVGEFATVGKVKYINFCCKFKIFSIFVLCNKEYILNSQICDILFVRYLTYNPENTLIINSDFKYLYFWRKPINTDIIIVPPEELKLVKKYYFAQFLKTKISITDDDIEDEFLNVMLDDDRVDDGDNAKVNDEFTGILHQIYRNVLYNHYNREDLKDIIVNENPTPTVMDRINGQIFVSTNNIALSVHKYIDRSPLLNTFYSISNL